MLSDKKQIKFHKLVSKLKKLNLDGETTQQLLSELGMENQMLRQLMMTADMSDVDGLYMERLQHEGKSHPYIHRLAMIKDDLDVLRKFIYSTDLAEVFRKNETDTCDEGWTHLNNIEIACDLDNDECLIWTKFDYEEEPMDKQIDLFITDLCKNVYPKLNQDSMSGAVYLYNETDEGDDREVYFTPFWDGDDKIIPVHFAINSYIKTQFNIDYNKPTNAEEFEAFKKYYIDLIELFSKWID